MPSSGGSTLGWAGLFRGFIRFFNGLVAWYGCTIEWLMKLRHAVFALFVAGLIATVMMLGIVPTGFIPDEDQGLMILLGECPPKVALPYTQ